MIKQYSSVILAGGTSSRMNKNKALCQLGDKMMIEYLIELFERRKYEILISGSKKEYAFLNYPIIEDNYKNSGPLSGIEAGLKASKFEKVIFSSCDTPFLSEEILISFEKYAENYDIVVPVVDGHVQPMTALYSKTLHKLIEKKIKLGELYPKDIIKENNTKHFTPKKSNAFLNINTPQELKIAENLVKKLSE